MIRTSVLWKPEDKQWGVGLSVSGKDENNTETVSASLTFYALLTIVIALCISSYWWKVIPHVTYSFSEIYLTFLNVQLRNKLVMSLSQPVLIHRRCRIKTELRQETKDGKSARIMKESRKHELLRMTQRTVERRKVIKVPCWRMATCCFLLRG